MNTKNWKYTAAAIGFAAMAAAGMASKTKPAGTFPAAPSVETSATLEAALRRIVEAHALAMWANEHADQETYETLANERDNAIEDAVRLVDGK